MTKRELLAAAGLQLLLQPALQAFSPKASANTSPLTQRMIETNGIRLNIAEQGEGPVVLLCHGPTQHQPSHHYRDNNFHLLQS